MEAAGARPGATGDRLTKLRLLHFSRFKPPDHAPVIKYISRKDLLDELNAPSHKAGHAVLQSPARHAVQNATNINLIKPRDIRKIDPAFATRLEPAFIVRTGCIIIAFGRSELRAVITPDALYCIMPPHLTPNLESAGGGNPLEKSLAALRTNLAILRAASASETAAAASLALSAPLQSAAFDRTSHDSLKILSTMPRSSSNPELTSEEMTSEVLRARSAHDEEKMHLPVSLLGTDNDATTDAIPANDHNEISVAVAEKVAGAAASTFEFCALEALLMTVCAELSRRQSALTETVQQALLALRRNVTGTRVVADDKQLESVRTLKQQVRELLVQSQALEEELQEVLDENEDLEDMYLSRQLHLLEQGTLPEGGEQDHEEAEVILESYLQEVGATVAELEVLTYGIEGTEKFVSFRLDSARNRLLKFDAIMTASATALGLGQLVAGIFGMNLPATIFHDDLYPDTLFWSVTGCTVFVVASLISILIMKFNAPPKGWFPWIFGRCCSESDDYDPLSEQLEQIGTAKGVPPSAPVPPIPPRNGPSTLKANTAGAGAPTTAVSVTTDDHLLAPSPRWPNYTKGQGRQGVK